MMQPNNLNIVVFDENQSFVTQQSRVNFSASRRPTTYDNYNSNSSQAIIANQISLLTQKINFLQEKAEKLSQLAKTSNKQNTMSDLNTTTNINNQTSVNSSQIQQLLRTVETKIQIVVRETKKIIQKITAEFDKKLQKYTSQKNHENNSIAKIQAHCRDTISKIQQNYQEQINIVKNQHMSLQKRLIQRVEFLQGQYKKKLKQFQNKQQEYAATIQHLENKLKLSSRSKKMIEVTQQKPQQKVLDKQQDRSRNKYQTQKQSQRAPTMSNKNDTFDNLSNLSSQIGSSNALPSNDVSKRRTKIFQTNRSISPHNQSNQVLSPLKSQNNIKEAQSMKNPVKEMPKVNQQKLIQTTDPIMNNYISNPKSQQISHQNHYQPQPYSQPYTQIKSTVIPVDHSPTSAYNQNYAQSNIQLQAPPKLIPSVSEKPIVRFEYQNQQQKQNLIQQKTSKQFLKDIPKPQWQRFQDFNQLQNSGSSQQDVFFYPGAETNTQPKSVFDTQHNSSMHSPFDLK